MNSKQVSIITVNFGSSIKLKNLKQSLLNHLTDFEWEWIIVDNFSSETETETIKKIAATHHNIHAIPLHKNLGYGEGNHEGVRFVSFENIAIVNPDTEITANTFDSLIANLNQAKTPTICVPVLQTKKLEILENVRPFPSIVPLVKRRLFGNQVIEKKPTKNQIHDWAQGSFWVLKKTTFEALNGFDTQFFLFFEDTDFCRRLQQIGGQVIQVSSSTAFHDPNRLSGGHISKAIFRKTFWIHLHSAFKYFKKWGL